MFVCSFFCNLGTKLLNHTVMKKILFLVVVLISMVSVKLYSSNQELVFEEPSVVEDSRSSGGECEWAGGEDCTPGNSNYCGAIYDDGKCNSDPPAAPTPQR